MLIRDKMIKRSKKKVLRIPKKYFFIIVKILFVASRGHIFTKTLAIKLQLKFNKCIP